MARTLLILATSVILVGFTGCAGLMHEKVPRYLRNRLSK